MNDLSDYCYECGMIRSAWDDLTEVSLRWIMNHISMDQWDAPLDDSAALYNALCERRKS